MASHFDTLAAAEALEAAGMESRQARACATQMQAAAVAGDPVTRPELEVALAALRAELMERIAEGEARLLERIGESEARTMERVAGTMECVAESERRVTMLVWRLFGGMAALAGLAVAALKYLP